MNKISLRHEINQGAAIASRIQVIQRLVETGFWVGIIPTGEYKRLLNRSKNLESNTYDLIDTLIDAEDKANFVLENNHD